MENLSKGLLVLSVHLLTPLYWNDLKIQSRVRLLVLNVCSFFSNISGFIFEAHYNSIGLYYKLQACSLPFLVLSHRQCPLCVFIDSFWPPELHVEVSLLPFRSFLLLKNYKTSSGSEKGQKRKNNAQYLPSLIQLTSVTL